MAQSRARLDQLQMLFRAANYLSLAELYLCDNALLRRPLEPRHIKKRLLGHWGTVPGINLVYAHLNRLIQDTSVRALYVVGTGHGAPGVLANLYLEGTLTERYPEFSLDETGLNGFVRAFSWPGGFPSHVTALTPGSLHEGGELGYSLSHAAGAALDDPDLFVACLVGDGEAETGPLAAAWHSHRFMNPATDGMVLPILHLNGYKLSGPSILARFAERELREYFTGMGYEPREVAGHEPMLVHQQMWSAMDWAHALLLERQSRARAGHLDDLPRPPVIILRTPKGWGAPATLDGRPLEGTFHAHQIPIEDPATNPEHLAILERWMRSYGPEELFDDSGRARAPVVASFPKPELCLGRSASSNGGTRLVPLDLPDYTSYAVTVAAPGASAERNTEVIGPYLRDLFRATAQTRNFRLVCPDETSSNRLQAVFEATGRAFMLPMVPSDEFLARDGRVMEVLSEHCCEGWLEGYLLSGRHGLFACYEAFLTIVDSMMQQYAKWLKMSCEVPWRAPIASLNYLITSHVWEQDHNGYSHQGPSFINMLMTKKARIARIYLPPDGNTLLSTIDHCLRSRDYVNLIVASKKPMPQWLSMEDAARHCAQGAGRWNWAETDGDQPDVVLACAGDVPTRETVAAAWWLRRAAPSLRVRVVNVVDLYTLQSQRDHPHGLPDARFATLFGTDTPVIFAFHGYPDAVHEIIYHRPNPQRFHVRGYVEEGTTTTPFDMTVLNGMSRYDLAIEALRRTGHADGIGFFEDKLTEHRAYIIAHGEDMPEVQQWTWSPEPAVEHAAVH